MTMMRLDPYVLLSAYSQGVFPMADNETGEIHWYDPNPRAIIPLDTFHVPRRLGRTYRNGPFELRVDFAFREVMYACAAPAPGRTHTWISEEFMAVYTEMYRMGYAHSVEAWRNDTLVGGLYGVSLRGLFAGESMFSIEKDASKVALILLVVLLRKGGFVLLDTQFSTTHLAQFGTIEISRKEYKQRLAHALTIDATF